MFFQLKDFLRLRPDWESIMEIDDDFQVIDDDFWEKIIQIVDVLEYPYLATKAMERKNFCYSDLYLWSMRISFKLDQIIEQSPQFAFKS